MNEQGSAEDDFKVELSGDHALVLFEWLSALDQSGNLSTIADPAERRVLWDLICDLETAMVSPFRPDYSALLEAAKGRIGT